jgi:hypothetical protein
VEAYRDFMKFRLSFRASKLCDDPEFTPNLMILGCNPERPPNPASLLAGNERSCIRDYSQKARPLISGEIPRFGPELTQKSAMACF